MAKAAAAAPAAELQLLCQHTFRHTQEAEHTDQIRFRQPVSIAQIRILPKGLTTGAGIVGETTPDAFKLEMFVHDVSKKKLSRFTRLAEISFGQAYFVLVPSSAQLRIDHLLFRGCYSVLSVFVLGTAHGAPVVPKPAQPAVSPTRPAALRPAALGTASAAAAAPATARPSSPPSAPAASAAPAATGPDPSLLPYLSGAGAPFQRSKHEHGTLVHVSPAEPPATAVAAYVRAANSKPSDGPAAAPRRVDHISVVRLPDPSKAEATTIALMRMFDKFGSFAPPTASREQHVAWLLALEELADSLVLVLASCSLSRTQSMRLKEWVVYAIDPNAAMRLPEEYSLRQLKLGLCLLELLWAHGFRIGAELIAEGVQQKLCALLAPSLLPRPPAAGASTAENTEHNQGDHCMALLDRFVSPVTSALISALDASLDMTEGMEAFLGLDSDPPADGSQNGYQQISEAITRDHPVRVMYALEALVRKANLYLCLAELQGTTERVLSTSDNPALADIRWLVAVLDQLREALFDVHATEELEPGAFPSANKGPNVLEEIQGRRVALVAYITHFMHARRTLSCFAMALAGVAIQHFPSIYQSIRDILLLMLQSRRGIIFLAHNLPIVSNIIGALESVDEDADPLEEDPAWPLREYLKPEDMRAPLCSAPHMASLLSLHISSFRQVDAVLAIDLAELQSELDRDARSGSQLVAALTALEALLTMIQTPVGRAAVASAILNADATECFLALATTQPSKGTTITKTMLHGLISHYAVVLLEVLMEEDEDAVAVSKHGARIHADLLAVTSESTSTVARVKEWAEPACKCQAGAEFKGLFGCIDAELEDSSSTVSWPRLTSALRYIVCLMAADQFVLAEFLEASGGSVALVHVILCVVKALRRPFKDPQNTLAALAALRPTLAALHILIRNIPRTGCFMGNIDLLVDALLALHMVVYHLGAKVEVEDSLLSPGGFLLRFQQAYAEISKLFVLMVQAWDERTPPRIDTPAHAGVRLPVMRLIIKDALRSPMRMAPALNLLHRCVQAVAVHTPSAKLLLVDLKDDLRGLFAALLQSTSLSLLTPMQGILQLAAQLYERADLTALLTLLLAPLKEYCNMSIRPQPKTKAPFSAQRSLYLLGPVLLQLGQMENGRLNLRIESLNLACSRLLINAFHATSDPLLMYTALDTLQRLLHVDLHANPREGVEHAPAVPSSDLLTLLPILTDALDRLLPSSRQAAPAEGKEPTDWGLVLSIVHTLVMVLHCRPKTILQPMLEALDTQARQQTPPGLILTIIERTADAMQAGVAAVKPGAEPVPAISPLQVEVYLEATLLLAQLLALTANGGTPEQLNTVCLLLHHSRRAQGRAGDLDSELEALTASMRQIEDWVALEGGFGGENAVFARLSAQSAIIYAVLARRSSFDDTILSDSTLYIPCVAMDPAVAIERAGKRLMERNKLPIMDLHMLASDFCKEVLEEKDDDPIVEADLPARPAREQKRSYQALAGDTLGVNKRSRVMRSALESSRRDTYRTSSVGTLSRAPSMHVDDYMAMELGLRPANAPPGGSAKTGSTAGSVAAAAAARSSAVAPAPTQPTLRQPGSGTGRWRPLGHESSSTRSAGASAGVGAGAGAGRGGGGGSFARSATRSTRMRGADEPAWRAGGGRGPTSSPGPVAPPYGAPPPPPPDSGWRHHEPLRSPGGAPWDMRSGPPPAQPPYSQAHPLPPPPQQHMPPPPHHMPMHDDGRGYYGGQFRPQYAAHPHDSRSMHPMHHHQQMYEHPGHNYPHDHHQQQQQQHDVWRGGGGGGQPRY